MDELRSWFEVPAIAHYFYLFRKSFELIEFDIEDFEETLLLDNAENVSTFLPDLVIHLLRGLYKTKDGLNVTLENYNFYLRDLLNHHYGGLQNKENPVAEIDFKFLNTRTKIEILYDMCNWRLELEDAMELTKDLEADDMRVDPVGKDNNGNVYWYFYGSRLYKEGYAVALEENMKSKENNETKNERSMQEIDCKGKKRKKQKSCRTKSGRAVKRRKRLGDGLHESEEESEIPKEIVIDKDSNVSRSSQNRSLRLNVSVSAWSLECSALHEWSAICDKYRGAKTKNEKDLKKNLFSLFETMPDIFHQKELALKKKLLSMAPRRLSDRITSKMRQREEEEMRLEQERLLISQQKAKEADERQKQQEDEKIKKREERHRERERIQEERALRAKQREEQKLVAENPELAKFIKTQPLTPDPQHESEEEETDDDEDNIYVAMKRIMKVLTEDDDAWPFLEPVKEEEAPRYYEFIKNPMDFKKIEEKIEKREYANKNEFESDVNLVFENCETYNGTKSAFSKLARIVKKVFQKLMKTEFLPDIVYEDDDFFEVDSPPVETKTKHKKQKHKCIMGQNEIKPKKVRTSLPHCAAKVVDANHAKLLQLRAQMKQLHSNAMFNSNPREYLTAASRLFPPSLGITPEVIDKMTPAQMQTLVLGFPRITLPPPVLQANTPRTQQPTNCAQNTTPSYPSTSATEYSSTTTVDPLNQLANTVLAPKFYSSLQASSVNSKLHARTTASNVTSINQLVGSSPVQLPYKASSKARVNGINVQAFPLVPKQVVVTQTSNALITVKWEDLQKQLVQQMKPGVVLSNRNTSGVTSLPIQRPSVSVGTRFVTVPLKNLGISSSPSSGGNHQTVSVNGTRPLISISSAVNAVDGFSAENSVVVLPRGLQGRHAVVTLPSTSTMKPSVNITTNLGAVNRVKIIQKSTSKSQAMPNIRDLQKDALQTAAINEISTKLNKQLQSKTQLNLTGLSRENQSGINSANQFSSLLSSSLRLSSTVVDGSLLSPQSPSTLKLTQLIKNDKPVTQNPIATQLRDNMMSKSVLLPNQILSTGKSPSCVVDKLAIPPLSGKTVRVVQKPGLLQGPLKQSNNIQYVISSANSTLMSNLAPITGLQKLLVNNLPIISDNHVKIVQRTVQSVDSTPATRATQQVLMSCSTVTIPLSSLTSMPSTGVTSAEASTPSSVFMPRVPHLQNITATNVANDFSSGIIKHELSSLFQKDLASTNPNENLARSLQPSVCISPASLRNANPTITCNTRSQQLDSMHNLSHAVNQTNSSPVTKKQNTLVVTPTQLQKLKEEGRIVMTPSGHYAIIPGSTNKPQVTTS